MRTFTLLLLCFFLAVDSFSQNYRPFEGQLKYEVRYADSLSGQPPITSFMNVYTNDTLVRIETESLQLGKQTMIKHLILNKYYILLEVNGEKYAIQHVEDLQTSDSAKFTFKKKFGSKRYDGKKAKKIEVCSRKGNSCYTAYYFKKISPTYTNSIPGIPGLPAEFDIQTSDGVFHYTLVEFNPKNISKDLFGIPSNYKKVSFDEFIEQMMNQTN